MNRIYQITAVACILLAAFVAFEAVRLKFYTTMGPGPGFFPLCLTILLAILAVIMFCQATFGRSESIPKGFFATKMGYARIITILISMIGTVLFFNTLGFRLTTFMFYFTLMNVIERQRLIVSVVISLLASFGVYYIFAYILMIPLPIGFLGI
jgi:putative tricarboxylic transport membrane protein